jgi:hypothetical protein
VLNQKKMTDLTTGSKIQKFFEQTVISRIENWQKQLCDGDLHGFEAELSTQLSALHDQVCEVVLPAAAEQVYEGLVSVAKAAGCRKIAKRPMQVRLSTGSYAEVSSPYVKVPAPSYKQKRHLLSGHWNLIGSASPALYDKVGFCAAICPSYDTGHELLTKFGVQLGLSSVREISNRLAQACHVAGEAELSIQSGESLAGKRVVIALDGGRTRTREYNGEYTEKGYGKYSTSWREPKLFVIDVLDEEGTLCRKRLPIYGCRFDQDHLFELLESYLSKLKIEEAKSVQLLGDGAPWIWNNVPALLKSLGVGEDKIIETLDAYHGAEYVHKLVEMMNSRASKKEKASLLKKFLNWFWDGHAGKIAQYCQKIFKYSNELADRYIAYLDKHEKRMQYADYKDNNLMCGSGIVESGVRRIINLQFKNTSAFWDAPTVEKLYFLRAAVLSKRWNVVIQNLAN